MYRALCIILEITWLRPNRFAKRAPPPHRSMEAPTTPAVAGPHVRPTRMLRVEPSGAWNLAGVREGGG